MENVPPDAALVAVNAVSMVKPAALSEYTTYNGTNQGGGSNGQGSPAAAAVFFKVPTLLLHPLFPPSFSTLLPRTH